MNMTNMPRRMKAKRETALGYWKKQLDKKTRSLMCKSSDDYIKGQIKVLEERTKGEKQ